MNAKIRLSEIAGKIEIRRRRVDRVTADHDQHLNQIGFHVADEIANRFRLVDRLRFDGIGINHGRSDVAKRLIHRVRQRMHPGRLLVSGYNDAAATMALQIANQRLRPLIVASGRSRFFRGELNAQTSCNGFSEALDFTRPKSEPVIGHRPANRWRAFDDVEPVHLVLPIDAPLVGKVVRIAHIGGASKEKIGVYR